MSLHNVVITIACDYCPTTINCDLPNATHVLVRADEVAADHGWWQKSDGTDVCPSHPRAVA